MDGKNILPDVGEHPVHLPVDLFPRDAFDVDGLILQA
jgi:hypothetical protein